MKAFKSRTITMEDLHDAHNKVVERLYKAHDTIKKLRAELQEGKKKAVDKTLFREMFKPSERRTIGRYLLVCEEMQATEIHARIGISKKTLADIRKEVNGINNMEVEDEEDDNNVLDEEEYDDDEHLEDECFDYDGEEELDNLILHGNSVGIDIVIEVKNFIEKKADQWPLKMRTKSHYLHSENSVKSLHAEFVEQFYMLSYTCFLRIFKTYCSHVQILSKGTEFCPKCYYYRGKPMDLIEPGHVLTIFERYKNHLLEASEAKQNYYSCQKLKKSNALVISFDFKSKINLPCVLNKLSSTNYDTKNTMEFFGIVPENRNMIPHFYVFDSFITAKKVDLIGSALIQFLDEFIKGFDMLYLFCDNTVSQNKNRFIVALLELARQRYGLSECRLNFMAVGHTHMKVDMCFGRVQKCLSRHNLHTPNDIVRAINGSNIGRCTYIECPIDMSILRSVTATTGITNVQTIIVNADGVFTSTKMLGHKTKKEETEQQQWNTKIVSVAKFNKHIADPSSRVKSKTLTKKEASEFLDSLHTYSTIKEDDLMFYKKKVVQSCKEMTEEDQKVKKKLAKK